MRRIHFTARGAVGRKDVLAAHKPLTSAAERVLREALQYTLLTPLGARAMMRPVESKEVMRMADSRPGSMLYRPTCRQYPREVMAG